MELIDIKEKKILFFSPAFFNYENVIADKMREMGAEVDMYDVRSVSGALSRAVLKISPCFFALQSQKYYEKIISANCKKDYDFILIVKCDMTPVSILKKLRKAYPNAKLCLYLWDAIDNIPGIINKIKYFDTVHSFDLEDCKKYSSVKPRPLFFGDQFRRNIQRKKDYKYDISFLGTVHSDRYAVITQIQRIANRNKLVCYWSLYLQSKFIFWYYKLTKTEFRKVSKSVFSFNKISAATIASVVDESRVILDIQHPKQTGLTMRTIEMLGMNKKIITTNASIVEYDFYNPNNIAIIDRKNVNLDMEFLRTEYSKVDDMIYEKYTLKNWILDVLN